MTIAARAEHSDVRLSHRPEARMIDVFISYSHDDQHLARWLEQRLTADGVSVWIDYKNILWGSSFPKEIEKGLEESRHIICIMSPSWRSSAWASIERYSALIGDP